MKKLFLAISVIAMLGSCTENTRVKNFGGEGTINLPKGRKLVNTTWKGDQVWYLTRPMTSADVAETYRFSESSSYGVLEGTFKIVETR